ncbi:MAG: PAS domain-containing protein, partial [Alphaproteobacteria bacterium]
MTSDGLHFSRAKATGLDINSYIEKSPIATLRLDEQGNVIEANGTFMHLLGWDLANSAPVALIALIDPEDRSRFTEALAQAFRSETTIPPMLLTLHPPNHAPVIVYTYITLM